LPAQKIGALLGAPELAALSRKARRLAELQQVYLNCAPHPLAQASRVADFKTGTLFLRADNAAAATKLKQLAPRLLLNIRKREPEVTGIKIAVQVKEITRKPDADPEQKHAGIENIGVFRTLADRLPESALKTAVKALVRRHGGRRQSHHE